MQRSPIKFWKDLPELMKAVPYNSKLTKYTDGAYKTNDIEDYNKIPNSYGLLLKWYDTVYKMFNPIVFCSLSSSDGHGWHTDCEDVLIDCLYGKCTYLVGDDQTKITLEEGETLFLQEGVMHKGIGDDFPRIALSMGIAGKVPARNVNYYYEVKN